LTDESPLVRGSAVWALSQLMDGKAFDALRSRHERMESDPVVLAEWARPAP
jgi:epoxyqueuosine reductase